MTPPRNPLLNVWSTNMWQIAMAKWNTACGWNFTENPEKVLLPVTLQFNQTRCRRCFEVMKARGKVNEGDGLAGFIIEGASSVFNPWVQWQWTDVTDQSASNTKQKKLMRDVQGGWDGHVAMLWMNVWEQHQLWQTCQWTACKQGGGMGVETVVGLKKEAWLELENPIPFTFPSLKFQHTSHRGW